MLDEIAEGSIEKTAGPDASSAAALEHVMDGLPDAVLVLDENWRIVYANHAARRLSRIEPENLNRETHWELYPETVGTNLEHVYREAMQLGEARQVEFYYEPFGLRLDVRVLPLGRGVALHYRDVTAVRAAEAARDAASEELQQVFDLTTDAIGFVDREWRFTFLNRRAKQLLASSGDLLGRNLWESFPETVYEGSPYVENYERAMNERVGTEFEAYYPAPLNVWLHIMARPAKDGMIVFFRDITKRRLQEDALRASEERYRVLTELNPQALWTADAEGRVLYANKTFLEYIGKDFAPKDGTEYLQLFYEDDRDRVARVWSHSVATGAEYAIDARLVRASDGAVRWWHLRALPLRDENDAIRQWLGVSTDFHENRIAVEQLKSQYVEIERQKAEMEAIYRGSPIGMALYEPKELRLLRLNDRQAEIFGMRPEEAIGKRYSELVPVRRPNELIARAALGEPMLNEFVEGELPTRPNEYQYCNVNYSPIFNEAGTVVAIAGATVEITQQKRAEAALMQSEKLAAVGRLASSIAHEINNPLESVMNLLYLARQYATVPQVKEFLDIADRELRRVSIIANQTLRFYRQSTKPQAIGCGDLFSTVLSIYEGKLKNSNIQVEKRKRAQKSVTCFEGEIRQVLNNLVGNAIDAMPNGGRLIVRSREGTDWRSGCRGLVLTVADTGCGIDRETQRKIFDAFFTTKGIGGSGLGLWISKEIMERHLGRILIRSRAGENDSGTVATLFLPFTDAPTDGNVCASE